MLDKRSIDKYKEWMCAHEFQGQVDPTGWAKVGGLINVEASGIMVKDIDGNESIDMTSCGLCDAVGYGNKEVAEAAKAQMIKLNNTLGFGGVTNIPRIELGRKLAELSPGISRFIFENSGSDAVETAIKTARWYWRQQGKDKYKIIFRDPEYHGATYGTMSATSVADINNEDFGPFVPGFVKFPCAYCYRCPWGKSYPGCDIDCAQALEETIEKEREDTVAAFIAEPVIGGAGFIVPPPEYWPRAREICTKHNVLLIMDEVITGCGRTGKFWAHHHWNITPDILTAAKMLGGGYVPIGAIGMSKEVYSGTIRLGKVNPHLHTFGGHPVMCAIALKVLEIMEREKLVAKAAKTGEHIRDRLTALKEKSPYVGSVEGLGLMWAIELVADKRTKARIVAKEPVMLQIATRLKEKGIGGGFSGIRRVERRLDYDRVMFAPSPVMSRKDLDYMLDTLESAILSIKV